MADEIVNFRAGWRPGSDEGRIFLKTASGEKEELTLNNPAEFTAVLTLLYSAKRAGIKNGVIWTSIEEVD